jgi:hypothetical protein
MFDSDIPIDCATCVAAGTTACGDCMVSHLLANDDGPIEFVVAPVASLRTPIDRAIALFASAGMLDDPPEYVPYDEFERAASVPTVR